MRRQSTTVRQAAALAVLALAAGAGLVAAAPASAASADTLSVDFTQDTGAFRGGASGSLYGLGDDGVPSQPVIDGARVTNVSQKPPAGQQHPSGDVLNVESEFFAGAGKDMYVYVQDEYPDWPYNGGKRPGDANGDGVWDYLPILKAAVEKVATTSAHPEDYVFIPFNEPDGGNWYPNWTTQKTQFLSDWSAAYTTIEDVYAEHGLGHARVGGPGDSRWQPTRTNDFLSYAKAQNQLPDVFIWHELGTTNMATFRGHYSQYLDELSALGLPKIPVNITEYGEPRDMGTGGQLIQWMSAFEDEKVDAQVAYWNYAGNLDDNSSGPNSANAGWWMFKWYGDLAGSDTVAVTPPQPNTADTLQGIGALDTADKKATVLFGGGSNDVDLDLHGLDPSVFGKTVNVQIRADRLNGDEGQSLEPPVILSTTAALDTGDLHITVPNSDRYTGYQAVITPMLAQPQPVDTALVNSTEAENATLTDATVYFQDPSQSGTHLASNSHDVGSFNKADSSATWTVTVPATGTYRLAVLAGTNAAPGEHALFVDGAFNQVLHYAADLGWTYRGTTYADVKLTAGAHTFSLRASQNGTTVLPGADITLDRFDLYSLDGLETTTYPATDARLDDGAKLVYAPAGVAGDAELGDGKSATFYAATADTGYQHITVHYSTSAASTLTLSVNGTQLKLPATACAGDWTSSVDVYLPQGIAELTLTASALADIASVQVSRGGDQTSEDTDSADVYTAQATDLSLHGAAVVQTIAASVGSNGAADSTGTVKDVGYLGNGAANTAVLTRPTGFGAGDYVLTAAYSNADKAAAINYNPQVITRFMDISETDGSTTQAAFRNNYSWNSFWNKSVPLTLTTASGALTLSNATAYAPNINAITLAKLVAGSPATTLAGNGAVAVTAPAVTTEWGTAAQVVITATCGALPATGNVVLKEGDTARGTADLDNGTATITLPIGLAGGEHDLTISYPGDAAFAPATSTTEVTVQLPAAWKAAAVYNDGDRVSYKGSVYQASWYTQKQTPGDPNGPWQEIAMTENGTAIWTASRIFNTGDVVTYNGSTYAAKWWTRNQTPGDPNGPWQPAP